MKHENSDLGNSDKNHNKQDVSEKDCVKTVKKMGSFSVQFQIESSITESALTYQPFAK